MSTKIKFFLFFSLISFCVSAQVKIGQNPNTIHSASIVELESTDKAFVLTRLSTAQMQAITPLNGAVVYNTDTQCVHYFNGSIWTNLCDGNNTSDFSFADNGDGTITLDDGNGNTVTFNGAAQTISTLNDNGDGTYTYTNENGIETIISIAVTDNQNLQTDNTPGNISIDNGNTIAINVDDADADDQNEIQSLNYTSGVLTLSNDPNATTVDLSAFDQNAADDFSGSFNDLSDLPANLDIDATDDYNTGISFDGTNLTVSDAGGDVSTDISGLAYDDTAIRADIDQNELDADNAIAAVDTKIDNHILADEDVSATNELSDIYITGTIVNLTNPAVGATGVDLGNTFATDTELADAITASEALDLDKDANNETNTAFASATNTLTISDSNGALTAPIVNSNELDISGGEITSTINGVASTPITLPVADGSETLVTAGTDISVSGTGVSGDPYVVANTFTEIDDSVTNEINTAFASATNTMTITDSNGALTAPIVNSNELEITAGEITSTINGVASTPIALPVADGSETVIDDGTNTTIAGAGTVASPYTITVPDNLDNSVINETNTAFTSATNTMTITDSNGALTAPIVNSNELDISGGEITSTINGVASTPITLPVADGSETLVTAGTDISVSGTGVTGDPYVVANTFTEIDDSVTNEINTAFTSATNTMTITDSNGALDATIVNTNELDITAGEITSTINGVASTPIALPVADGSETLVTAGTDISVSGTGVAGDPYVVENTFTEIDDSVTNETNTAFTSATNTLTITDSNGALDATIVNSNELDITAGEITSTINGVASTPIALPVADGSETLVTAGTDISVSGTGVAGDPYVVENTFTEIDDSVTNEINTAFTSATNTITITDSNGALDASIVNSNELDITAGEITSTINGVASTPIALPVADGSETVINDGTNTTIAGAGTAASPYTIAVPDNLDNSVTNETNTAFASATNTMTITDSNGALDAPIVNTNELDITAGEITSTINGVASTPITLPIADGSETLVTAGTDISVSGTGVTGDPYVVANTFTEIDDSVTNEINTAFASATNTLTITDSNGALTAPIVNSNELEITAGEITSTINGVASTPITLPVADGSETLVTAGTDISVSGTGVTGDPYVVENTFTEIDDSVTNEINTAFTSATNTLTITDSNGALTAPIVNSNELEITAGEITSTINGVASTPITLPVADGSETLVIAGTDISVSGTGVTGDPYVVENTFTEIDDSVTNEINTAFTSATNTLTITDSNGALTAPIVNSNELEITAGEITSTINGVASTPITLPVADGSETVLNDGTNTTIAGAGTVASPYTIAVPDNLDNSVTNETNTAFTSAINTLTITDSNGALDAPIVNTNELDITAGEITSTINGVASTPITLPVADGSETVIDDGTNTTIAGAGTVASPYTIAVPDNLDNSVTNELSDLSLSATNILTLTNPLTGSNQVDLSTISTDDQTVEMFAFNGSTFELLLKIEDDPTTQVANLSSLYADGTETEITAGAGISITGDGSSTLPYNIINDFTEVDGSITNETNTSFSTVDVAGVDYLRISDSNGDLDVPLSDLSHTGTTGSVFFAGADGTPTENNSQLFWDATNNRLSIGNPLLGTNKLTVNGTTRTSGLNNSDGSTTLPSYRFSDDSDTGIYSPAADEIGLVVGEIEALKVEETSGNTSVIINETLELEGAVLDENDSPGTAGQVLTSTATGTEWVNSMSPIKAIGKISSAGTVTKATAGVTVTRISVGYYRVTLPTGAVSDADYIIQLTQPGRGGAGNDDPGISYSNQTATSFEVIIGDNDNGGTDRSRFDSEFMFTVLDL
ncbi:beta strand repeat-containing protein [Maribacter litoralis]|uniref:beta strand repeat-containing protein n=1 Tax=Maribacter litoralis TaxID=2059726 RepID=UPI003D268BDC